MSAVNQMWTIIFSLPSVFTNSIALLIVAICLYLHYKTMDYNRTAITATEKLSRRLGSYEKFFLTSAKVNNTGYINTVLFLESKVKLDQVHVKNSLLLLLDQFPLLRMRVVESRFSQPRFEAMENPQGNLDFQQLDVDSEEWLHAFEKQINGRRLDTERGPLWRVTLLKETVQLSSDHKENLFKNTLLFTFHHVVSDGLSIFEFLKKLVEFMGLLYHDKPIEVKSFPFRPELENTMQHLIGSGPSILERISTATVFNLRKLSVALHSPKPSNPYLLKFHSRISSHSVPQKTYVVPRSMTKEETIALIRCSKANKCTVHGAITAATHLAISRLVLERRSKDLKNPLMIDSTFTVNVRKECQPKVESQEFGLYVTFNSLQIKVHSSRVTTQECFWDFACSCTSEIHSRIHQLGSHRNVLKLFQCVNPETFCALSRFNADYGLYRELFNLTNLGSLSIDPEGKSPYRFAGSHFAVQCAKINYAIGHNIFTVNNQLYWTVEYSPEVTSKTQAEKFVDLSLRILVDACAP